MNTAKIVITLREDLLDKLDSLVKSKVFPNRNRAVQKAVEEKLARMDRGRLARECAKLDPKFEQALAEEGVTGKKDVWPEIVLANARRLRKKTTAYPISDSDFLQAKTAVP